jgi:diguanylate cyclase (GGDEF)-like protein
VLLKRQHAEARANSIAISDGLTGLLNRRGIETRMAASIATCCKARVLFLLDLDNFKPINDIHGHQMGDAVLYEVAQRLLQVPGFELVGRLGGDEFVVLSTGTDRIEDAMDLAGALAGIFQQPCIVNDIDLKFGCSIGAVIIENSEIDFNEALRRADIALYRAKDDGRNRVAFFEPMMDAAIRDRATLEKDLQIAIANDDITPHFQKIVDLKTKQTVGFEVLARWYHPEKGQIPPDHFIPIAEQSGLIHELGLNLLRKATAMASGWPSHLSLSVNVSPVQLRDATIALKFLSVLADTRFLPQRLEIEITENALLSDLNGAKQVLDQFRAAGIGIVLDDFGTGQSTLNHLKTCRFDKIKIDRSFVQRMENEPEDALIVDAILGLSKGFGLRTVAEGIEQSPLVDALIDKGCQLGQGYFFGRPLETTEYHSPVIKSANEKAA